MSREHAIIAAIAFFAAGGSGVAAVALILWMRLRRRDAQGPLPRRKHPVPAPLASVAHLALVRPEPGRRQRAAGGGA
jgi:hypothetical protein